MNEAMIILLEDKRETGTVTIKTGNSFLPHKGEIIQIVKEGHVLITGRVDHVLWTVFENAEPMLTIWIQIKSELLEVI